MSKNQLIEQLLERELHAAAMVAAAAHASMRGEHALAIGVFRQQLTALLAELR